MYTKQKPKIERWKKGKEGTNPIENSLHGCNYYYLNKLSKLTQACSRDCEFVGK